MGEDGAGHERLLGRAAQRPEVDHEAAGAVQRVQRRAGVLTRPHAPLVDAEVAHAAHHARRIPMVVQVLEALRIGLIYQRDELGVLVAVRGRVELQGRRLLRARELAQPHAQPLGHRALRAVDADAGGRGAMALRELRRNARPGLTETHEVGVRIEHDHLERGLDQQLLEHRAQCVGLARAGLAAQERVPVEAARVEREPHARREPQLAERQPRAGRSIAPLPVRDLVGPGGPHRCVVERRRPAVVHRSPAGGVADRHRRRQVAAVLPAQLAGVQAGHVERLDLAQPRAVSGLENDVAAHAQRERLERSLQGETPPVERRGEREHAPLDLPPQ